MDLTTILISIFGSGGLAWVIAKVCIKSIAKDALSESLDELKDKYTSKEQMQNERKELLEEIISSISFPVDIESIVSRIPEGLIGDVNTFPTISVKISKLGEKDFVTTDEAIFKNGEFDKLTLTRNGRKITVDQFDTWSYSTDIANVAQTTTPNHGKALNYGYKAIPVDEFEHLESPQVLVNEAKECSGTVFGSSSENGIATKLELLIVTFSI